MKTNEGLARESVLRALRALRAKVEYPRAVLELAADILLGAEDDEEDSASRRQSDSQVREALITIVELCEAFHIPHDRLDKAATLLEASQEEDRGNMPLVIMRTQEGR